MSVDLKMVKHVAHLAHIALSEEEALRMARELDLILTFINQINEVDVTNIEPMVSSHFTSLPLRADSVTDGNKAGEILSSAPAREGDFFLVPKLVE